MKKNLWLLGLTGILILLTGCGANPNYESSDTTMAAVTEAITAAETTGASAQTELAEGKMQENKSTTSKVDSDSPDYSSLEAEGYLEIEQNQVVSTKKEPSTAFSLKVDTASFTNVRRYIESGNLPPKDAVRTEEMLNYFEYYEKTQDTDSPFSIYTEIGGSPFDEEKKLALIRVKTEDIEKEMLPDSNFTFLIDTSGSMDSDDKLPLLKSAFKLFVDTLDEDDKISIVTYAGSSEIVLDSVSGADKDRIMNAIQTLTAEGSTAGANGIQTAYELTEKNFKKNGNNRIILASDGDFNVGISSLSGLENLISEKRDSGVYFSVLGFGYGNLQDDTMETLATHGNGNYSYIDSVDAAKKVLVDEMGSNLFVVANDTKAQIQFNAEAVKNYRLIGYENRKMTSEEFQDDKKDAGEIGVGTDMIVLVEFEPENGKSITQYTDELFTVKIRYKNPGETESLEITAPVKADRILSENTSDFNFAKSVAMFAELLRDSQYGEGLQIDEILQTAMKNIGKDSRGYRTEFVEELIRYKELMK